MSNKKHSLIRTIYLYLFTLIGLGLLVVSGIAFINMGLRAFVFTLPDKQERMWQLQPPMPWIEEPAFQNIKEKIEKEEKVYLTEEQITEIKRWLAAFKNWEERRLEIDPVTTRRHNEAARYLAMILIGLPLYLYHWGIIKKETQNKEEE